MDIETQVERHYGHGSLEQAIFEGLEAAGKPLDRLTPADFAPVDEFHIGGREATAAFADGMNVKPGLRLLDVGAGLGGASRYFAAELGCEVDGVDLSEEYVAVAQALARRVGLQSRVRYHRASALQLPFADASFDGAYMMHVGMNIDDKARLFAELRRVVRPGGGVGVYDIMRERPGPLSFPSTWASGVATSFVETAGVYSGTMANAGFEVGPPRSQREIALTYFQRMRAAAARNGGAPPPFGLHILMGASAREKIANMVDDLRAGLIAPTEIFGRAI